VYRRAEARGEIRGSRFVAGFVGEQFALPEALEVLRSVRKAKPDGRPIAVSACDPLNLAGVLTPGPRVPAVIGNRTVFLNGVPVASVQSGEVQLHGEVDQAARRAVSELLGRAV
jgi:ATP-dependent Lhr-like helicase